MSTLIDWRSSATVLSALCATATAALVGGCSAGAADGKVSAQNQNLDSPQGCVPVTSNDAGTDPGSDAGTDAAPPAKPPSSAPDPLVGVYVGNDPNDVFQFEGWLGAHVEGVLGYTGTRDWNDMDPGWQISALGSTGRRLFWSIPPYPEGTDPHDVASGAHDAEYESFARKILESRSGDADPIYVRTAWELEGEWFYWSVDAMKDPATFQALFRHFYDSFHRVSPRFRIVWDASASRGDPTNLWPDDAHVDVVSQDVYWQPQWSSTDPAAAFAMYRSADQYGLDFIATFAAQHGKPIAISEWGIKGDDAGPFIDAIKQWMVDHKVVYATYWNSDSSYTGKLSDDRWPHSGAAYKADFRP